MDVATMVSSSVVICRLSVMVSVPMTLAVDGLSIDDLIICEGSWVWEEFTEGKMVADVVYMDSLVVLIVVPDAVICLVIPLNVVEVMLVAGEDVVMCVEDDACTCIVESKEPIESGVNLDVIIFNVKNPFGTPEIFKGVSDIYLIKFGDPCVVLWLVGISWAENILFVLPVDEYFDDDEVTDIGSSTGSSYVISVVVVSWENVKTDKLSDDAFDANSVDKNVFIVEKYLEDDEVTVVGIVIPIKVDANSVEDVECL